MGGLEDLPEEKGEYKYVVFKIDEEYFLRTGSRSIGHAKIAKDFFDERGEQAGLTEIYLCYANLGVLGGGFLEWDPDKKHITYYTGCMFGPYGERVDQFREEIKKLMEGSSITYEAPLDEMVEERDLPLIDPITRMHKFIV